MTSALYPSLREQRVLITGGATGIGATLVERFAAQGARVGFIDIAADAGRELAARLPGCAFVAADLTDIAQLRAAIATLREQLG
ncbi:SDR family NAD(P)-dependent oxidoreductase, partial [Mitsuaria sp. TWR114]|uniref:SDR family NAD(P)-dependent oxidoreductase n=2 Tax=unclassified Roseateles TaxID=2626991 RepID=UPI0011BEA0F6